MYACECLMPSVLQLQFACIFLYIFLNFLNTAVLYHEKLIFLFFVFCFFLECAYQHCICGPRCTCGISTEVNCDPCKLFKAKMAVKAVSHSESSSANQWSMSILILLQYLTEWLCYSIDSMSQIEWCSEALIDRSWVLYTNFFCLFVFSWLKCLHFVFVWLF